MLNDDKLRQIGRARRPQAAAQSLGHLLEGYRKQFDEAASDRLAQVYNVLQEVGDDHFRRHCRVASLRGSTLIIAVDDPGLVYGFRRSYLFALRDHLARHAPQARVTDIRFEPLGE